MCDLIRRLDLNVYTVSNIVTCMISCMVLHSLAAAL